MYSIITLDTFRIKEKETELYLSDKLCQILLGANQKKRNHRMAISLHTSRIRPLFTERTSTTGADFRHILVRCHANHSMT